LSRHHWQAVIDACCLWYKWKTTIAKVEKFSWNQGEDKGQNTTEQHHMARVV